MVKALLLAVALLLTLPTQALTQLSAHVDKNPALRGEAITLDVTADARVAADAINFRILEQDFTVMVPSVSTSTQIINGEASQRTSWKVVLLPKKTGSFVIPSFSLQGLSTQPITLQILDGSVTKDTSQSRELFLEATLEQQQLYVQQLSYYQVTIYFNGDLQRGSLSEPQLDDASISQVGQDIDGSELVNGIRYRTITRRYAITPQRSGTFTIAPPTFSGEMVDRDSARYNYFARTKSVVQQAQPLDVNVKAIPDNFPGDWLVAGLVTLTEEWSPDLTELKQGEPVTRTITLSAVDVAQNQLPDLIQGFPDGLRLYQEQPQAKSAERSGRMVAQKIFTTAVIANKAGDLELPEVTLPWWNSQTDTLDYARLPKRTLTVAATEKTSAPKVTNQTPALAQTAANGQTQTIIADVSGWQWNYLSSLLLALWLGSLFIVYLLWQLRAPIKNTAPVQQRVRFNSAALKQACNSNNAALAKTELLRFSHQQLDRRCQSLSELATYFPDTELQQQLNQLNAALYSSNADIWQGNTLWQTWQRYQSDKTSPSPDNSLAPLYPR